MGIVLHNIVGYGHDGTKMTCVINTSNVTLRVIEDVVPQLSPFQGWHESAAGGMPQRL